METDEDGAEKAPSGTPTTMHAVTADGQTVPITFNPETGQYQTPSGDPVVIQVHTSF